MANPLPASFLNFPIVDPKTGQPTIDFLRFLQNLLGQTANLNLDGSLNGGSGGAVDPATLAAQVANLDSNGIVKPAGIDMSRAYVNKYLNYIPDGGGRYSVTAVDGSNKALIDFSQSGHVNKTLDNVPNGSLRYAVVTIDANGRAIIDFSQTAHLNKTLDNVGDGTSYGRTPVQVGAEGFVANGNFLSGSSGWNSISGYPATLTVITGSGSPYSGNYAQVATSVQFGGFQQSRKFAVVPGEQYKLSAYLYSGNGDTASANLVFYNQSGVFVGQLNLQTSSAAWIYKTSSTTVPAGSAYAVVTIQDYSATPAGTGYVAFANVQAWRMRDTPDIYNNAISQAASGSNGTNYGTVNTWITGANAAVAGGGLVLRFFSTSCSTTARLWGRP
ncbi:MAG: hypothetical protein KGL39_14185 [Patescibacteria group bacterium]|nr:hypothetical protein [Patescibacteria group bacterium]